MTLCREFEGQTCKFRSHGGVYNKNTIEEFKKCDKTALINEEGNDIWQDITTGLCLEDPSRLSRFTLVTFAVKNLLLYRFQLKAKFNTFFTIIFRI